MEAPTYGMTNYPTLMYKRHINNIKEYYKAVQTAKADIIENLTDETEQLNCMIEYLQALYSSLNKPAQKMSPLHDDIINYFKGEINFCQIAQEVMHDDS